MGTNLQNNNLQNIAHEFLKMLQHILDSVPLKLQDSPTP